jgi:threonine aldolase
VLAGSDAVVGRARTMLHRLGGASVHRAGIAAAAGIVALDTMVDRVADDHRRARELAAGLAAIPGFTLRPEVVETNIVLVDVIGTGLEPTGLLALLDAAGVRAFERDTTRIRFVTHRLIGDAEIERAVAVVAETVERHAVPPVELPEIDDSWEAELDDLPDD